MDKIEWLGILIAFGIGYYIIGPVIMPAGIIILLTIIGVRKLMKRAGYTKPYHRL